MSDKLDFTPCHSIDIGFVEKKDSWLLHPRFFPSKVGGKPAWLDLENLTNPKDMLCKECEDPLVFLCQIYAPFEDIDQCFHRTIFIFICKNGTCCKKNFTGNILVLRSQLPRENKYYSYKPYEEIKDQFPMVKWCKLCDVCGLKGPSHCSQCKSIYYCSRKHQILDWQREHKQLCPKLKDRKEINSNAFTVTESGKTFLFDEWEIIIESEDKEEVSTIDEKSELEKINSLMKEKKAGTLNNVSESELEQYATNRPKDKIFSKFTKRIGRHPDQILRYDRGGTPLWITEPSNNGQIPPCQYCNSERQFEFQIMPQLLNFINVGIDINSIDWGILAIYTCKNSCSEGPAYKEEYLIKQDITN